MEHKLEELEKGLVEAIGQRKTADTTVACARERAGTLTNEMVRVCLSAYVCACVSVCMHARLCVPVRVSMFDSGMCVCMRVYVWEGECAVTNKMVHVRLYLSSSVLATQTYR